MRESTLRNYFEEGRQSKPGYEVLEKLYYSFKQINLYWLFGEPGEPLLSTHTETNSASLSKNKNFSHSQVIGSNTGSATQHMAPLAPDQLAVLQRENELLKAQLTDKEKLVQEKERTIQILLSHQPK